ncbi:MAG TPA: MipA/OmpV family protein [Alphaproteobacteria bacterium]|nr:MipA/OmpV family protein [Alphaproteobacteria bacterium]MDP7427314.1 MipA/OmpV family protein [Alphaproteobacteria bacterium]HJM50457.1 MipA/OmpV family protein [Alphaproteobacteria bacterium]
MRICLLMVALVLFVARPAVADDYEQWLNGATAIRLPSEGEWRVLLGAGGGFAPNYPGSDEYEVVALPLIDIEWRGAVFLSTQRGLGYNMVRKRDTMAGPRLTWDRGRNSADNATLSGLPDIKASPELGLFFKHFSGPWRFTGDIRMGLTDKGNNGVSGSFGTALGGRLSERASLFLGADLRWGGSDYMNAYYGVSASNSATNLATFSASAGIRDISAFATAVYLFSPQLYLAAEGRLQMIVSTAAESPLTKASELLFVGTTVGYLF